jgi:hypothetical protein
MITIYGKSQTKDSSEVKNIMKILILDVAFCGVEIYWDAIKLERAEFL